MSDWSPGVYGRFRDLRLRPALDLLAQVPPLPPGAVVDLGCGNGAVAAALRSRFPAGGAAGRLLAGVDASPAMLAEARELGLYDLIEEADAAGWVPAAPPALIFSNAALHWLPDHETLLPRLARLLAPGGTLAVQMPAQHDAPSHALLRRLAAELFPDRFDRSGWPQPVRPAIDYARLLGAEGEVSAWETEYVQSLPAASGAHPVRLFTEATAMRPVLARLRPGEAAAFTARYEAELAGAYPAEADGRVLFPFRRVFLRLTVPG